jgi:hypothetical protein
VRKQERKGEGIKEGKTEYGRREDGDKGKKVRGKA